MLLSVYIISYNQEKYIAKAIDSALMQETDFEYEIVIGDDFSTDKTKDIIQSFKKRFPDKIRLVPSDKNVGAGLNSIKTLKHCKGKYIASLEGDDFWLTNDKLQKQVDILERDNTLSMCFTDRSLIDEKGEKLKNSSIPERFKRRLSASDIIGGFTPPTQTVVFRSEYLDEKIYANLANVFNGESFAFSYFSTFGDVAYLDEVTASYRVNNQGVYSSTNYIERLERREVTSIFISEIISEHYKPFLYKGFNAVNQRLYVLYFRKFMIRKFMIRSWKLLSFDFKNSQLSFIKANRLLIKSFISKKVLVRD